MASTIPVIQKTDLRSAIFDHTFPAHPHFPQLEIASDAELMLEVFRRELKSLSENSHIDACLPVRFSFRNSGSCCILQYSLFLAGVHITNNNLWVTATIYPNLPAAKEAWAHQQSDKLKADALSVFRFEPLTFVPELKMVIEVFPHDRLMPNLSRLMDGGWPELDATFREALGAADWEIDQKKLEPLRYVPGETAVIRYTCKGTNPEKSETTHKRFYLKLYRTRYGEEVWGLLRQLRGQGDQNGKRFTVAEPIAYFPERRGLLLNEAPGRSFQASLLACGDPSIPARRVARALAAFHRTSIRGIRSRSAEEQIQFLGRTTALLSWALPESSPLVRTLEEEVNQALRDTLLLPIHWDLKADHIFLQNDALSFIDLDTVCLGDPARDPAHLAAHISCRIEVPDLSAASARAAADTLIEEYFGLVPPKWREQFSLQYAIAVVEAACGLFKRQAPNWRQRAAQALKEATRFL
jgi:hypothetical protein